MTLTTLQVPIFILPKLAFHRSLSKRLMRPDSGFSLLSSGSHGSFFPVPGGVGAVGAGHGSAGCEDLKPHEGFQKTAVPHPRRAVAAWGTQADRGLRAQGAVRKEVGGLG